MNHYRLMQNIGPSATSSLPLKKLKLEFFESGVGDTIIITFPDGGVGVVDAHPSRNGIRPDILSLLNGKTIHFVCLTHPHADHGKDLVPILRHHPHVVEFWHTVPETMQFIYKITQTVVYPSPVREFALQMQEGWAKVFLDIFEAATDRRIPDKILQSNIEPWEVGGVRIHILSPSEGVRAEFRRVLIDRVDDPDTQFPDENRLSAIIALELGNAVVLLGADGPRDEWRAAHGVWKARHLPAACVLKVPHHGSSDAVDWRGGNTKAHFLEMCRGAVRAHSVNFAGDQHHPSRDVYALLRNETVLHCLGNGLKAPSANPLGIRAPRVKAVAPSLTCQPMVAFEVDEAAQVAMLSGLRCEQCPNAP